ncbi:MAG: HPr family phosphocarrier protein [Methylophilaceae bacterium]|jgi:phosphocarrier protein HPr|nr:HPr family phosphocarrier protein [Methylophilaceae bacterium]MDG2252371.1 HPr family phosphocarrier protein [Methylophilaceae bacterium]
MIKKEVKIINKLGLHARASSKLTQLASQFDSEIFIIKDSKKVNAKNIMDILMLAASIGSKVELQVTGSDEKIAIKEVENLFKNYFDEGE